ncbi:hypothetical protein PWT90_02384 [Aphanocladium album]|nr:hypothetical protein PWT90_02384 [Aphanocladium album]
MEKKPFTKETHVYVSRQSTDIHLDVYTSKQANAGSPILLWFHGGYLITGSRIAIPDWLLNYAHGQNWTVVSPDYRVLPESTGLATVEDLQSAYEWVVKKLPCFHAECDTDQIIIGGASAGMTGFAARHTASGLEVAIRGHQTLERLFPLSCEFGPAFPATIIVHGTADRGVSHEESEALLRKLQAAGLAAHYFPEPGADHAFDIAPPRDGGGGAASQPFAPPDAILGCPTCAAKLGQLELALDRLGQIFKPCSSQSPRRLQPHRHKSKEMDADDDTAAAMAAAMGFSSFGAQNPSSKKRKYNHNNDAVVSIDNTQSHGTGANSAPLAERRAPPANADEIALDDDDDDDDEADDGAHDGGHASAANSSGNASADAGSGIPPGIGAGIAGLPQRPAPPHGGFPGHQQRRGGGPRHGSGGHHGINKLWYEDYYDHFSNENPWAKLEKAAGLEPISTWVPVHINRDQSHQPQPV